MSEAHGVQPPVTNNRSGTADVILRDGSTLRLRPTTGDDAEGLPHEPSGGVRVEVELPGA